MLIKMSYYNGCLVLTFCDRGLERNLGIIKYLRGKKNIISGQKIFL